MTKNLLPSLLALSALVACSCRGTREASSQATTAPLVVHQVLLAGQPSPEASDALGVLLERAGAADVDVADTAFLPDRHTEPTAQAAAFGAFAKQGGPGHALFADLLGTPGRGVDEVRGVLADRAGNVVWQTRLRAGEPAFDRAQPTEPMACLLLLVRELQPVLGLGDPERHNAPTGPLAAKLQARSGVPDAAEQTAMAARLAAAKRLGKDLTLVVVPPRLGAAHSGELAEQVAAELRAAGYGRVRVAKEPLPFRAQPSPNEQRVLWSAAHSLRSLQARAGGTEYVLAIDLLLRSEAQLGAVHTFLLEPSGSLVWVDLQNDHHRDFQAMATPNPAAGAQLAARRLLAELR
jgi:hypothetical protein